MGPNSRRFSRLLFLTSLWVSLFCSAAFSVPPGDGNQADPSEPPVRPRLRLFLPDGECTDEISPSLNISPPGTRDIGAVLEVASGSRRLALHTDNDDQETKNEGQVSDLFSDYVQSLRAELKSFEGKVQVAKKLEQIGRGTFKIYYRVLGKDGKTYAMASVPLEMVQGNKFARFLHDLFISKVLSVNRIPNVAFLKGINEEDGNLNVFFELAEDKDLKQLQETGVQFSKANVYSIAKQTCRALVQKHEIGIVHKDLKRGNIFAQAEFEKDGKPLDRAQVYRIDKGKSVISSRDTKISRLKVVIGDFGESLYFKPEGGNRFTADPILRIIDPEDRHGHRSVVHPDSTTGINKHPYFTVVDYHQSDTVNFRRYQKNDLWQFGVSMLRLLIPERALNWQNDGDNGLAALKVGLDNLRKMMKHDRKLDSYNNIITWEMDVALSRFKNLTGMESDRPLREILECALDPFSMDELLDILPQKRRKKDCDFKRLCGKLQGSYF